jgi:hypothetical protein
MKKRSKSQNGQSIVELALVLPMLVIILVGMVEVGSIFYDYLIVTVANREGVRLASRGRFEPDDVAGRVIAAGGGRQVEDPHPHFQHHLRTTGPNANFGMIITSFPIDAEGNLETDESGAYMITTYLTGTLTLDDGTRRPIEADDSRVDMEDFPDLHSGVTVKINEMREAADYDPQRTEIIVVETFFAHDLMLPGTDIVDFPDPLTLYVDSSMRVLRDRGNAPD